MVPASTFGLHMHADTRTLTPEHTCKRAYTLVHICAKELMCTHMTREEETRCECVVLFGFKTKEEKEK